MALLVACGGGTVDGAIEPTTTTTEVAPRPAVRSDLDGRTFTSTSVEGFDVIGGQPLRLTFSSGLLSGLLACAELRAPFELDRGELRWVVEPVASGDGCEPELAFQDRWLANTIVEGVDVTIDPDGTLLLASGDLRVALEPDDVAGSPRPTLFGTPWVLETLTSDGETITIPSGSARPTIRFSSDGTAEVFTGCNPGTVTATLEDSGTRIDFRALTVLERTCPEGEELELLIRGGFDGSASVIVQDDLLTLVNGSLRMLFSTGG
jgi:heat shock protein HslJ